MSAKEWRKVFADEKKFNLDSPNGFRKTVTENKIPEENYLTRYSECGSFMIGGGLLIFKKT